MCQALGLYELRQHGATCVQAPRCHHTAIPQCVAPTHSKKKNPLREKNFLNQTCQLFTQAEVFRFPQIRMCLNIAQKRF